MSHLVLIRHGQSEWNAANRFNGWIDTQLSLTGIKQAQAAGQALKEEGLAFDAAYSSALSRTIMTIDEVLTTLGQLYVPQTKSWRLNERHYGSLQGENKDAMFAKYGHDQVQIWRRSYEILPPKIHVFEPEVTIDGKRYPAFDRRYNKLKYGQLPVSENIQSTVKRVLPLWQKSIRPELEAGKNILIVAHGTSVRALTKIIEGTAPADIVKLEIPNAEPIVYNFDNKLNILNKKVLKQKSL